MTKARLDLDSAITIGAMFSIYWPTHLDGTILDWITDRHLIPDWIGYDEPDHHHCDIMSTYHLDVWQEWLPPHTPQAAPIRTTAAHGMRQGEFLGSPGTIWGEQVAEPLKVASLRNFEELAKYGQNAYNPTH